MQLRVRHLLSLGSYPPTEIGAIFFGGYISDRWFQIPEKDIPSLNPGQGAYYNYYF